MNRQNINEINTRIYHLRHFMNPDRSRFEFEVYELLKAVINTINEMNDAIEDQNSIKSAK